MNRPSRFSSRKVVPLPPVFWKMRRPPRRQEPACPGSRASSTSLREVDQLLVEHPPRSPRRSAVGGGCGRAIDSKTRLPAWSSAQRQWSRWRGPRGHRQLWIIGFRDERPGIDAGLVSAREPNAQLVPAATARRVKEPSPVRGENSERPFITAIRSDVLEYLATPPGAAAVTGQAGDLRCSIGPPTRYSGGEVPGRSAGSAHVIA